MSQKDALIYVTKSPIHTDKNRDVVGMDQMIGDVAIPHFFR